MGDTHQGLAWCPDRDFLTAAILGIAAVGYFNVLRLFA